MHTSTHYKPHTYTHPHITNPTHTHTHALQTPHIHIPTHYKSHTYPHITNPTHTHTHTSQNQSKQPQHKIHTKWNSHNAIKYRQYKVTLMYMVLLSPRTSPLTHATSLQNKITSHKSRQFTPHQYNFTSLHLFTLNPHFNSLTCNYILNPLSKRV